MPNQHDDAEPAASPSLRPVLFVSSGPLAHAAVATLHQAAEELRMQVRGVFGFVQVGAAAGPQPAAARGHNARRNRPAGCRAFAWQTSLVPAAKREPGARDGVASLAPALAQLLRRMRQMSARLSFRVVSPPSVEVYVLVDLNQPESVQAALDAVCVIRRSQPTAELTGLLLTGRSAESDATADAQWEAGFARLLGADPAAAPPAAVRDDDAGQLARVGLHRVYLLDGCSSQGAWLPSRAAGLRMAAEFLLHHGLSPYSRRLRAHELQRIHARQPISDVLGSFCCRTVVSDREAICEEAADQLLDDGLFPAARDDLLPQDEAALAAALAAFERRLLDIFARQARTDVAGQPADQPAVDVPQETAAALRAAIRTVCESRPLRRLEAFMPRLHALVQKLRMKTYVEERRAERVRVANALRAQEGRLPPIPLHAPPQSPPGAAPPGAGTAAPSAPVPAPPPAAPDVMPPLPQPPGRLARPPRKWLVPQPVPLWRLVVGAALAVVGALAGAALLHSAQPWLAVPVALATVFAGALCLDLPTPWVTVADAVVNRRLRQQAADTELRCCPPLTPWPVVGLALAALGAVLLALAFSPANVAAIHWLDGLLTGVVAAAAVFGAVFQRPNPVGAPSGEHYLGSDYPRPYPFWRPLALLVLVGVALHVFGQWPVALHSSLEGVLLATVGLGLLAAGVLTAAWPARDQRRFEVPVIEDPVEDVHGVRRAQYAVRAAMDHVHRWLGSLAPVALVLRKRRPRDLAEPPPQEYFLNAVANEWRRKIADLASAAVLDAVALPDCWAEAVLAGLNAPRSEPRLDKLDRLFTVHAVRQWLDAYLTQHSWTELIRALRPAPDWLERYFARALAPMWPFPDGAGDVDQGLAAAGCELVAAAAEGLEISNACRVEAVAWAQAGRVALVRIVQGLPPNWLEPWRAAGRPADATARP